MKKHHAPKFLTLAKQTLKNMSVRSGVKAGLSGKLCSATCPI